MIAAQMLPDLNIVKKFEMEVAELSKVIAGIALESFRELLYNSPQRYGSYVASWSIGTGSGGYDYEAPPLPVMMWYKVGSEPAIAKALSRARGFKSSYSRGGRAIYDLPPIQITNSKDYADYIQTHLRDENRSAFNHFQEFEEKLSAKLAKRIYAGMGTWNYYRDYNV